MNVEIRLELGEEEASSGSNFPTGPTDDRVIVRSFRDGAHRAFTLRCSFPHPSDMETETPQRQDVGHGQLGIAAKHKD